MAAPGMRRLVHSQLGGGHLDVLKYLHENGCPWNEMTCECAAAFGHLDVLKYAQENGCPWIIEDCWRAAERRYIETGEDQDTADWINAQRRS